VELCGLNTASKNHFRLDLNVYTSIIMHHRCTVSPLYWLQWRRRRASDYYISYTHKLCSCKL